MTPEDVFVSYMRAKARHQKRPYSIPKHWEKIKQRKDWNMFALMSDKANNGQLALFNIDNFFDANFQLRDGRFSPSQFFAKTSFTLYLQWQRRPHQQPTKEQLIVSMKWVVQYLKNHQVTFREYFEKAQVYPLYLQHLSTNKLHKYILAYYFKKHRSVWHNLQSDVVEHAIRMSKDKLAEEIDLWYMQLINDDKSYSLVKRFMDKMNDKH